MDATARVMCILDRLLSQDHCKSRFGSKGRPMHPKNPGAELSWTLKLSPPTTAVVTTGLEPENPHHANLVPRLLINANCLLPTMF